ncbi:MAG: FitA-like ribbon-helix-helix domain-containing protein [Terriglobia bacterium]
MPDLTLRRLPQEVHRTLRRCAQQHGRSLNAEILAILDKAAEQAKQRQDLTKVISEINRLREEVARKYPHQPDSADLIREDRDSR